MLPNNMTTFSDEATSSTTVNIMSRNASTAMSHPLQQDSNLSTTAEYTAIPEGCAILRISGTDFVPWDNPHNIVSAEVELTAKRVMERIVVPILFLIGGPANVINMVVFYKQGLKERINLCLFALSLADGLYLTHAMFLYGEQLPLEFTTNIKFDSIFSFMVNHRITALFGLGFVSQILSAIIASERCVCVVSPLKFQTLLRTKTMAVIIICIYVVGLGLYFFVTFKHTVGCVYDPRTGTALNREILGEFYLANKEILDYLDSFVFGYAIHGFSITVVTSTTIITIVKLRQVMTWRAGTSSSISAREVALTKMLIGSSLLFIACITPHAVYRVCIVFIKEFNVGRRYHNSYLTLVWIVNITTFFNSTFNFFVYYAMGSRYRECFWKLFSKKTKSNKGKETAIPKL